jgi:hypothetical protein
VVELVAKYPYTVKPSSLQKFLTEVATIGMPEKINTQTLPTMGYKSKNDRALVPILRFINFIDGSGIPTQNYKDFKNRMLSKSTMAKVLQAAYIELFKLYPNAYQKDDESLSDFFSGAVTGGADVLKLTVTTFKTLCSFADFKEVPQEDGVAGEKEKPTEKAKAVPSASSGVTINLNIQLTLPATENAKVYESIFKALKDNLLTQD